MNNYFLSIQVYASNERYKNKNYIVHFVYSVSFGILSFLISYKQRVRKAQICAPYTRIIRRYILRLFLGYLYLGIFGVGSARNAFKRLTGTTIIKRSDDHNITFERY